MREIVLFVGIDDEIGLVVGIGPVVGISLFWGTGLVVSLTYMQLFSLTHKPDECSQICLNVCPLLSITHTVFSMEVSRRPILDA